MPANPPTAPTALTLTTDAFSATFDGIAPQPGLSYKIFERTESTSYDYTAPLRDWITAFPYTIVGRTNKTRFFFVVRAHDPATGLDSANSNEVACLSPRPAPAPGTTEITFDDVVAYVGKTSPSFKPIAGDRYKAQGVLLTDDPSGPFIGFSYATDTPFGYLFAKQQNDISGADGVVTINFVLPGTTTPARTDSVSFRVVGMESLQNAFWTARAYNNAGALLATQTGTAGDLVSFSRPAGDISKVTFSTTTAAQASQVVGHMSGIDALIFGNLVAL